ncbi:18038_t:CDS:2, partial [Racocetra persica]
NIPALSSQSWNKPLHQYFTSTKQFIHLFTSSLLPSNEYGFTVSDTNLKTNKTCNHFTFLPRYTLQSLPGVIPHFRSPNCGNMFDMDCLLIYFVT